MNEIEIRGKISPTRFKELKILLEKSGRLLKHYHRLSVDVSPGFDEKTRTWNNPSGLDFRVKKSDNEEKISLKIGHFYEKERSEIDVALVPGEFLNAITLLDSLGYSKGMVYFYTYQQLLLIFLLLLFLLKHVHKDFQLNHLETFLLF